MQFLAQKLHERPRGENADETQNNAEQKQKSGAVLLTDDGRRAFLGAWQSKKQEQITHPFLKEKIPWGLVPYVQALLLARTLRGDLEAYPPFFWK